MFLAWFPARKNKEFDGTRKDFFLHFSGPLETVTRPRNCPDARAYSSILHRLAEQLTILTILERASESMSSSSFPSNIINDSRNAIMIHYN